MADDETPDPSETDESTTQKPEIPAEVKAALRKANKEAETLRLKLKEIEDAEKSEVQKLQDSLAERDQQLAELPKAVRQQAIRFASTASHLGFIDPEDALTLVGDVDLADDAAVKAALADLAERKPHLIRAEGTGPKVPPRPKPKDGEKLPGGEVEGKGKARAAEALRLMRNR